MAIFDLLSMNHLEYLQKEVDFGVLELNHSSNNTVVCLHGFGRVSKNCVSGGLPVLATKDIYVKSLHPRHHLSSLPQAAT